LSPGFGGTTLLLIAPLDESLNRSPVGICFHSGSRCTKT